MTVPTIYVEKNAGSGQSQVYPLLGGTVLGTQDGADFGVLSATGIPERPSTRTIEAFGKKFTAQGRYIYEKPATGGAWTQTQELIYGAGYCEGKMHGWRILHPGGRPVLAIQWKSHASWNYRAITFTWDGDNWTTVLLGTHSSYTGDSITFRDSYFAYMGGGLYEYNFATQAAVLHMTFQANSRDAYFCVKGNTLYLLEGAYDPAVYKVYVFQGGNFNTVFSNLGGVISSAQSRYGGTAVLLPDGDDMVILGNIRTWDGSTVYGSNAARIASTGAAVGVAAEILLASMMPSHRIRHECWEMLVDNNSNPGIPPTIHIWHGEWASQVWTSYTFQYRAITYGAPESGTFVPGDVVTGSLSGATGVVHAVVSGKVHLTNVVGTFNDGSVAPETLTADSGAYATSSDALVDQQLVLNGSSISFDFALPSSHGSVGPYIPTYPSARIEMGITGVRLDIGVVTSGPFVLGETVTDQSNGATGIVFIDNGVNLIVYRTNATQFGANAILGAGGASATVSAVAVNAPIPSHEVIGGRKHYCKVYGDPSNYVATLYIAKGEEAPWEAQTIISVALESGTPPGTSPSVLDGTVIDLPADNGVRVWSFVHDANDAGLEAGDTYELSMDAV
jgi:hypothetical protein